MRKRRERSSSSNGVRTHSANPLQVKEQEKSQVLEFNVQSKPSIFFVLIVNLEPSSPADQLSYNQIDLITKRAKRHREEGRHAQRSVLTWSRTPANT